jgi:hypothetical protein
MKPAWLIAVITLPLIVSGGPARPQPYSQTSDTIVEQLELDKDSVNELLIPIPYHPKPSPGCIRFRVVGAPRRSTKLGWEDVLTLPVRADAGWITPVSTP